MPRAAAALIPAESSYLRGEKRRRGRFVAPVVLLVPSPLPPFASSGSGLFRRFPAVIAAALSVSGVSG